MAESGLHPWLTGSEETFLCCSWVTLRVLHPAVEHRFFPDHNAWGAEGGFLHLGALGERTGE